jgi:RimJ/RimL family protein N-acetyltransferase
LRLHALRTEPGVYFSSYETEVDGDERSWIALASGDEAHQLFGLFDGARLIAISGVFTDVQDTTGSTALLGMSYVLPEYRGRGLALRCYEARLAWARARPRFVRAIVGHRRSNEATRRAIEHFGFRWTGGRAASLARRNTGRLRGLRIALARRRDAAHLAGLE